MVWRISFLMSSGTTGQKKGEAGFDVASALPRPRAAPVGADLPEPQKRAEAAPGFEPLPVPRLLFAPIFFLRVFLLGFRFGYSGKFSLHRAASILLAARQAPEFCLSLTAPQRRGAGRREAPLSSHAFRRGLRCANPPYGL